MTTTKYHGMTGSPEYRIWSAMIQRCHNPRSQVYRYYGERGIVVCDRWRASFSAFFADMGSRPAGKYSLDRIDNNGNYEPRNCRWVSMKTQSLNKTSTRWITHNGETRTMIEWAKHIGISYSGIQWRLRNMSVSRALELPIKTLKKVGSV